MLDLLARHPEPATQHGRVAGRSALARVVGLAVVAAAVAAPGSATGRAAVAARSDQAVVETVDFERDVRPILEASCVACHGPDVEESRLRVDSPAALWRGGVSGHAIVPGDRAASPLMRRLTGADEPLMPFGGDPLPAAAIDVIGRWIDQLRVETLAAAPTASSAGADHWAYVPPRRPDPPVVSRPDWVRNPIDRFVLARLDEEGLEPSPEAPPTTLIRRLSLDLIGLPPSVAEVDAFLADARPDAYERLVDRLLASPRYGERWARPWLDLARYADTHGYEKDNPRTIWKYRDWVIHALNDDMPFDRFTIEQLAGDMLPDATLDQRIATGFHRNTLLNQEGGVDDEEARFENLVDRTNTTATVWLGSTLGCAQCHNHKFDAFSQREYYELLAFFDNAEYEIAEFGQGEAWVIEPILELPTPEQRRRKEAITRELERLRTVMSTPTPELEADRARWEAAIRRADEDWTTIRPDQIASAGGATLTELPDGSILASGANPDADTYELTATTDRRGITGIRLEVLEDASLPNGGPGRDPDGNFFLSGFELDVEPVDTPTLAGRVPFARAEANDQQFTYEVQRALVQGPGAGGWAIDATPSDATLVRQAVFVPHRPFGFGAGTRLRIRLRHDMPRAARNIGRFRLSLTTVDDPTAIVKLPARAWPGLELEHADRIAEQVAIIDEVHRSVTPLLADVRARVRALERELDSLGIVTTLVMRERTGSERPTTHFRNRGSFMSPGDPVQSSVPDVLHPFPDDQPPNRLGLAHWLVDERNPLVARVTVNRHWEQIFGRGLVETSEDFGVQGDRPSHPRLLDWLATEFMREGWSMKTLVRTIVTSATYRQSSHVGPDLLERDPYNRLLARGARFRVEAEMVRDIALAASGLLSDTIGGPSVFPYQPEGVWNRPYSNDRWITSPGRDRHRRGIYTYLRRTAPYPSLLTFDAPSREVSVVRRVRTNTPLQALTILNDPVYVEAAQHLARRLVSEAGPDEASRIDLGFRTVVARRPSDEERETVRRFYRQQLARFSLDRSAAYAAIGDVRAPGVEPVSLAAWTLVANVLLNLDETITKE